MKCTVCAGHTRTTTTDLPFKMAEDWIVILKQLPVLNHSVPSGLTLARPLSELILHNCLEIQARRRVFSP
jgi:hypothetical protein